MPGNWEDAYSCSYLLFHLTFSNNGYWTQQRMQESNIPHLRQRSQIISWILLPVFYRSSVFSDVTWPSRLAGSHITSRTIFDLDLDVEDSGPVWLEQKSHFPLYETSCTSPSHKFKFGLRPNPNPMDGLQWSYHPQSPRNFLTQRARYNLHKFESWYYHSGNWQRNREVWPTTKVVV